jgi:glycosyltransferase involved in cell wall biosynthesis
MELRDLWAGNPAYERRPGALDRIERMLLASAAAVVAVTPEAAESLRRRHPGLGERLSVVPNGYEPELLERRSMQQKPDRSPIVLLHSGTLVPGRPLAPLVAALARRPAGELRLVLHGYTAPELRREVDDVASIDVLPPSSWAEAIEQMRAADVCVITQSRAVGDATAIPGKVYEYLALGKPVLCISDGGATEQLLRRLGADALVARLGDPASIDTALGRIVAAELPPPIDPDLLAPYSRAAEAGELARLLDTIVAK